jgi:hypothetical protein
LEGVEAQQATTPGTPALPILAGAFGRPTWILSPWTPDYRWLLGRDDSPWYPTVPSSGTETRDYASVLDSTELLTAVFPQLPELAAVADQHPKHPAHLGLGLFHPRLKRGKVRCIAGPRHDPQQIFP